MCNCGLIGSNFGLLPLVFTRVGTATKVKYYSQLTCMQEVTVSLQKMQHVLTAASLDHLSTKWCFSTQWSLDIC